MRFYDNGTSDNILQNTADGIRIMLIKLTKDGIPNNNNADTKGSMQSDH